MTVNSEFANGACFVESPAAALDLHPGCVGVDFKDSADILYGCGFVFGANWFEDEESGFEVAGVVFGGLYGLLAEVLLCGFNPLNTLAGLGDYFGVGDVAEYLFVGCLGFFEVVGEFVVVADVVLHPRIFGGFFLQLFDELGSLFVVFTL